MNQATNTDRDAINPEALAEAITTWRCDRSDEADIALEAAFLEQGVITPDEVVSTLIRVTGAVVVHLDDGSVFAIDTTGKVFIRAD